MLDIYEILNALAELVYIVDTDSYELLYMNESAIEKYHLNKEKDSYKGKKCYEILQHLDSPCEFCTNHLLKPETYYSWEYYNNVLGGYYYLRDKLINHNGKLVRFEIATNISALKEQNENMAFLLSMDDLLIRCTAKLHENLSLQVRIDAIFQLIGETLKADRVYLFKKNEGVYNNTHEWCRKGITPQLDNLQNIDEAKLSRWLPQFRKNECVIITDIPALKERFPGEYEVLTGQDISSLVCAPVNLDGELVGFIGVDNPPVDSLEYTPPFFSAVSYFLASMLSREKTEKQLLRMSYQDALTGLQNRNRYMYDIGRYNEDRFEKMGVVFVDLNGLKEINDTLGHICGDRKLIRVAQILKYVFDEKTIYRIGGDEFCVLCTPVEEYDFNRRIAKLREFFANPDDCHASMGFCYCAGFRNVNDIVRDADRMMYESKRSYYRRKMEGRKDSTSGKTLS